MTQDSGHGRPAHYSTEKCVNNDGVLPNMRLTRAPKTCRPTPAQTSRPSLTYTTHGPLRDGSGVAISTSTKWKNGTPLEA
jgi:hypothetical protein